MMMSKKLLLTADKDIIYYTTDGTDPDLTSTKVHQ